MEEVEALATNYPEDVPDLEEYRESMSLIESFYIFVTDQPFLNSFFLLELTEGFEQSDLYPFIAVGSFLGGSGISALRDWYHDWDRPVQTVLSVAQLPFSISLLNETVRNEVYHHLMVPAVNMIGQGLNAVVEELEQVEFLRELIDGFEQQPEALIPIAATIASFYISNKINQNERVQNWKARRAERESAIDEGRDVGLGEGTLRGLFGRRQEDTDEEREARQDEPGEGSGLASGCLVAIFHAGFEQLMTILDNRKSDEPQVVGEYYIAGSPDGSRAVFIQETKDSERDENESEISPRPVNVDNQMNRTSNTLSNTFSIEGSWEEPEASTQPNEVMEVKGRGMPQPLRRLVYGNKKKDLRSRFSDLEQTEKILKKLKWKWAMINIKISEPTFGWDLSPKSKWYDR